jgi:hypothetical protein
VYNLKFGKKPARPGAMKLGFDQYFTIAELPIPPAKFGKVWVINDWGMLGNDTVGNCVFAGGDHETMLWTSVACVVPLPVFNTAVCLLDYASTGYIAGDPSTDQGADVTTVAEYRRTTGLLDIAGNRHKIDAYVSLKPGDLDQLSIATYVFGAVGLGLNLPSSALDQFSQALPWEASDSPSVGGHYVSVIGRNSKGYYVGVSWGRLQAMSPDFITKHSDEAVCYLSSLDWCRNNISPLGMDVASLQRDLSQLGQEG